MDKQHGKGVVNTRRRLQGRNTPCREEENLVFWFGAQFISRLNFTQSG